MGVEWRYGFQFTDELEICLICVLYRIRNIH